MEVTSQFSDAELLQVLRTGRQTEDAIRQLYRTQFNITRAYIYQNNGTEADAEDIFQEVLVSFIEMVKKDKFRGHCSVSTFIQVLTRHTWLNELKKRGRARIREEKFENAKEITGMDISHYINQREMKSQLMQMVDSLGETCKKILLAFYFDNLSMKEILQSTSFENEQVVRNKKYKCLKSLEQKIAEKPGLAKNLTSILSYE